MSSVRVVSPDWDAVFASIQAWADAVVQQQPLALGVLLYGSLGRGDYAPGSDADLLVVVRESPHRPAERAALLPPLRLPICHEVVVYSEQELASLFESGFHFVRRALAEGRWLARRPGWEAPALPRPRG